MRVIITEKPSVNDMLARVVGDVYPDEEIYFIEAQPFWLNNFRFPKGLSLSEYPFFGHPVYKRDQPWGTLARRLSRLDKGLCVRIATIDLDGAREVMLEADEVICACDWDHTGMWGFDLFIEQTLGGGRAPSYPVLALKDGLDPKSINRAFRSMITTDHESYRALLSAGKAKRLLEYNYAVNSLAILGNLYRKLAGTQEPVFVSKYALQVLIWLDNSPPTPVWKLHDKMGKGWAGTGKYAGGKMGHLYGMGSAASRQSILQDLVTIGLLRESEKGVVSITELGHAYVRALHPDCSDADLPFRLDAWMTQGIEVSEPAIKRYLNTFFGKQARHQSSSTAK